MSGVDALGLAMPVGLGENGFHAVLFLDPLDFAHHDIQGFIPRDALVFADTAVLWIPLTVRVPVHSLEGIEDSVGRIDPVLVAEAVRRDQRSHGRRKGLAASVHLPRFEVGILPGIAQWPDTDDPAIVALHLHAVGIGGNRAEAEPSDNRFLAVLLLFCF